MSSLECFGYSLKCITNKNLKESIRNKMNEIMDRAEYIKQNLLNKNTAINKVQKNNASKNNVDMKSKNNSKIEEDNNFVNLKQNNTEE
jgi:hypothetical protein